MIKLEFEKEDLEYVLKVLHDRKLSLGLVGVEVEEASQEYQINQRLRGYIERNIDK